MSLESFAEKILTDIKADLANLVNLIKGQKTLENGESNATLDEASLNAHAANILRNHASKITGESAGTPQAATQEQPAVPVTEGQAPAADTNLNQNVSESSQGNESTVPSTPTTATPTTNDGA